MARKPKPKPKTCGVCGQAEHAAKVYPRGNVCPVNGPHIQLPTARGRCSVCGGGAFMVEKHPALDAMGNTCLTCGTMKPAVTEGEG